MIILGHAVLEIYQAFLAPLLPFLIDKLQLSLAMAGLLASIQTVTGAILQPLFGVYIDRSAVTRFLVLGPLVAAVAGSLLGLAPSFLMAAILMALGGLACAAYHPEATSAVHHATRRGRGLAMSIFMAGGTLGWAIGPILILWLVERLGLGGSYLAVIPGLLLIGVIWRFGPRRIDGAAPGNGNGHPNGNRNGNGSGGEAAGSRGFPLADLRANALPLVMLWLVVVLNGAVNQSFMTFLPVFWKTNGMRAMTTGVWLSAMAICGAVGGVVIAILSDRLGRRVILASILALAAPLFLLYFSSTGVLSWLGLLGGWFILGGVSPIIVVTGQELNKSGAAMTAGLMMGFGWAGGGLLVTAVGALADRIGTGPALRSLLVLPVAAAALAYLLPKPARSRVPAEGQAA